MFLFYVASVTSQSGLLLLLIGLISGSFIVNWTFSTRNVKYLGVSPPQEVYLEEGGSPTQPWRFENPTSKHAEVMEIFHGEHLLFRLPVVKTKESLSVAPQLVYTRRGVYPNTLVTISSAAPYGLIRASRQLQIPGEVVVFPKIYGAESPAALGVDMITGGRFRGGKRVNGGSHFAGVRPWQAGDSFKQVHWATTARRGEMMVKTFEEELGGRVSIVLDCCSADLAVIDNAVRAAASLGAASLFEGHHLEFFDLSIQPILRLAPFADEGEFLERLARYDSKHEARMPNVENFWRRSTIALIGTAWRTVWAEFIMEARGQNRPVQIYLPSGTSAPPNLDAEIFFFAENEIWPRMERTHAS